MNKFCAIYESINAGKRDENTRAAETFKVNVDE